MFYRRSDAAWQEQVRENTARLSNTHGFYSSHGWGEFRILDPTMFDVTFVEEPVVAYGFAIDGDALVPKRFPRAFGGVSSWLYDEKGFYIGANVFLIVDTLSPVELIDVPTEDPNYDINHYFTFSGIAIKDVEEDDPLLDF